MIAIYAGFRNMLRVWPVLLVSGGAFALTQYVTSNYISYALTDVLSSLVSLILTIAFLRIWKPAPDERFAVDAGRLAETRGTVPAAQGWIPWIVVSVVVIVWTVANIFMIGDTKIAWPGLDKAVYITLYNQPYGAIWDFQPRGTGTFVIPPFGILWSALFLHERVSLVMLEGCALVLVGTALATGAIRQLPFSERRKLMR